MLQHRHVAIANIRKDKFTVALGIEAQERIVLEAKHTDGNGHKAFVARPKKRGDMLALLRRRNVGKDGEGIDKLARQLFFLAVIENARIGIKIAPSYPLAHRRDQGGIAIRLPQKSCNRAHRTEGEDHKEVEGGLVPLGIGFVKMPRKPLRPLEKVPVFHRRKAADATVTQALGEDADYRLQLRIDLLGQREVTRGQQILVHLGEIVEREGRNRQAVFIEDVTARVGDGQKPVAPSVLSNQPQRGTRKIVGQEAIVAAEHLISAIHTVKRLLAPRAVLIMLVHTK